MKFDKHLELLIPGPFYCNKIYRTYNNLRNYLMLTCGDKIVIFKDDGFWNFEKFQTITGFKRIISLPLIEGLFFEVIDKEDLYFCNFDTTENKFKKKTWAKGEVGIYAHNGDDCWVVIHKRDLKFNLYSQDMITPVREKAHDNEITSVDYNFLKGLATGDANGVIKVWTHFADKLLNEFHDFYSPIQYLKLINGKRLIASDNRIIKIYNLEINDIDVEIPSMESRINDIYYYNDDKLDFLFVTYKDGTLKVWDIVYGGLEKEYSEFSYTNPAISATRVFLSDIAILSKQGVYIQKST